MTEKARSRQGRDPSLFQDKFLVGSVLHPMAEGEPLVTHENEIRHPHDIEWYLERMLKEEQGNLLCFWGSVENPAQRPRAAAVWRNGLKLAELMDWFLRHDRYAMTLYAQGHNVPPACLMPAEVARVLGSQADRYIGEDIGECLNSWFSGRHATEPDGRPLKSLRAAKARFIDGFLGPKVQALKAMGYPRIMTTGHATFTEYEMAAGVDIPFTELMLNFIGDMAYSMSAMRGACRKWNRPWWGCYFAHDWYTKHIPYESPRKYQLLRLGMDLAWMNGAFGVLLESGNWATSAGWWTKGSSQCADYEAPACRRYRRTLRDFHRFTCRTRRDPSGPLVTTAFALGNLDGFSGRRNLMGRNGEYYRDRPAVWGLKETAKRDERYFYGDPELGWDILFRTAYPMNPKALAPHRNHYVTGAPFGPVDVVGIDAQTPDALLHRYKLIVYTGWNTMEPAIYGKLVDFVRNGGTLLMGVPHLSMRDDRESWSYTIGDLVHQGDLRDFFGVRVLGPGAFIDNGRDLGRWKTPYPFYDYDVEEEAGQSRRIIPDLRCEVLAADVEILPGTEVLYASETRGQFLEKKNPRPGVPLLVRRKLGRGRAYLTTVWSYPGAIGLQRLYEHVVRNLLLQHRSPRAHLDDPDLGRPGPECANVFHTVYRKHLYVLNTDLRRTHRVDVTLDGQRSQLALKPGELLTLDGRPGPVRHARGSMVSA